MSASEWACEPHTAAKHALLREYIKAWVPIIAQQAIKTGGGRRGEEIRLIDGFAGPGRYAGGEDGSPLILLKALLAFDQVAATWSGLRFRFVFIEKEPRSAALLRARIDELGPLPRSVTVDLHVGRFEDEIEKELGRPGAGATFAFIDPFGYSHSPMDLTRGLLLGPRVETLTFVPMDQVFRFTALESQDAAFDRLFGCRDWEGAKHLEGDARREFLEDLYARQLTQPGQAQHALTFRVKTLSGAVYTLFFATNALRGAERMKDSMWKVDPLGGTTFVSKRGFGQEALFAAEPNYADLATVIADQYTGRQVEIAELEQFVTLRTIYRKQHVRKALKRLDAAELSVDRPAGTRSGYPAGTMLRFT